MYGEARGYKVPDLRFQNPAIDRACHWQLRELESLTGSQVLLFHDGRYRAKVQRIKFADRQIETITGLKDLRRVVDLLEGTTQVNVAQGGSPLFTRDIGS